MKNIITRGIEISSADMPNKMAWSDIAAAIEAIGGNGWRLPDDVEFGIIYHLCKGGVIPFKPARYWSTPSFTEKALYYDLGVGYSPHYADVTNLYYVKLVRNIDGSVPVYSYGSIYVDDDYVVDYVV